MPVYTYRCENCGIQFDRQQHFSDPPLTRCPECNKKALRKVYSPVGIVFKGSGFYATDHRSPSGESRPSTGKKSAETKKESGAEASPETSSASSSEKASKEAKE